MSTAQRLTVLLFLIELTTHAAQFLLIPNWFSDDVNNDWLHSKTFNGTGLMGPDGLSQVKFTAELATRPWTVVVSFYDYAVKHRVKHATVLLYISLQLCITATDVCHLLIDLVKEYRRYI